MNFFFCKYHLNVTKIQKNEQNTWNKGNTPTLIKFTRMDSGSFDYSVKDSAEMQIAIFIGRSQIPIKVESQKVGYDIVEAITSLHVSP